jgi:hypothetical protein
MSFSPDRGSLSIESAEISPQVMEVRTNNYNVKHRLVVAALGGNELQHSLPKLQWMSRKMTTTESTKHIPAPPLRRKSNNSRRM